MNRFRRLIPARTGAPGENEAESRGIFFDRWQLWAALGLLILGVATGHPSLALIALLGLAAAGMMAVWNRLALERVNCTFSLSPTRAFPGEQIELIVAIANRKLLPVPWFALEIELAGSLTPVHRPTITNAATSRKVLQLGGRLGANERVTWRIPMTCEARGVPVIGPSMLRTGDPLGFFANRVRIAKTLPALVFPRRIDASRFDAPPVRPIGETRVKRLLLTDPLRFAGIRDYRPEDPFRSIHWKATARQGQLQVRVPEPTTLLQVGIFANLDTFDHYWEGLDVTTSEQVIEIAAAVATWAAKAGSAFGLYANGIVAGSDQPIRLTPSKSPAQLGLALEALARITPFSTIRFFRHLNAESGRFPRGSTLVVISSVMPELLEIELQRLVRQGQRLILIPVGACPIPKIRSMIVQPIDVPEPEPEPEEAIA
jgi:uncharacterized protein (DUF58 family)